MAVATGTIDLKQFKNLDNRALHQYFWFESDNSTVGAGAHITNVPENSFRTTPTTSGKNALIASDGLHVRDGLTDLAVFGQTAVVGMSGSSQFILESDSLSAKDHSGNEYFSLDGNGLYFGTNTAATVDGTPYWQYKDTTVDPPEIYDVQYRAISNDSGEYYYYDENNVEHIITENQLEQDRTENVELIYTNTGYQYTPKTKKYVLYEQSSGKYYFDSDNPDPIMGHNPTPAEGIDESYCIGMGEWECCADEGEYQKWYVCSDCGQVFVTESDTPGTSMSCGFCDSDRDWEGYRDIWLEPSYFSGLTSKSFYTQIYSTSRVYLSNEQVSNLERNNGELVTELIGGVYYFILYQLGSPITNVQYDGTVYYYMNGSDRIELQEDQLDTITTVTETPLVLFKDGLSPLENQVNDIDENHNSLVKRVDNIESSIEVNSTTENDGPYIKIQATDKVQESSTATRFTPSRIEFLKNETPVIYIDSTEREGIIDINSTRVHNYIRLGDETHGYMDIFMAEDGGLGIRRGREEEED